MLNLFHFCRLLCDRAEKFLKENDHEDDEEVEIRLSVLRESLSNLRQALRDHDIASAPTPTEQEAPSLGIPTICVDEPSEEGNKGKEQKDQANVARLKRSSCRRRVSLIDRACFCYTCTNFLSFNPL
jgi:hypothetical protein